MNYWQIFNAIYFYFKATSPSALKEPFWKMFCRAVLDNDKNYYAFEPIENIRKKLLHTHEKIEVIDRGAGSKINNDNHRNINKIAKFSATTPRDGKILFHLVDTFQPKVILELGTSLGIGSLYMAMANTKSKLYTIEGNPDSTQIARLNFETLNLTNIHSCIGPFAEVLPDLLTQLPPIDMVFLDGHHDGMATKNYYQMIRPFLSHKAMVVLDDIYWSKSMSEAFYEIRAGQEIQLWADFFTKGILFLDPQLSKYSSQMIIPDNLKPWKLFLP